MSGQLVLSFTARLFTDCSITVLLHSATTHTTHGPGGDWRSAVMAHHRHIIGQSGVGKSTLMKSWIISAIHANEGVCYIDPHGTDTDDLIQYVPRRRRTDVVIFDPTQYAIAWNPLQAGNTPLVASLFVESVRTAWGYSHIATPRMDSLVYNIFAGLIEAKESLFGAYLMLVSERYRAHVVQGISDPVVRGYWHWYETLTDKQRVEWSESTFNKVQILMADPRIRAICGVKDRLNIPTLVKDKILFIRLPQGEMGVERVALIGSLLLTQLHQALLARDTTVPFHLFIDEVHTFAPNSIMEMLSGIRKHGVSLTVAHQYLAQLDQMLRSSLQANAEAYVFRTSIEDSRAFPKLGESATQPHELLPFQYWHMGDGKPTRIVADPLPFDPYEASARAIHAHITRNLVSPATHEVKKLLEKFGNCG